MQIIYMESTMSQKLPVNEFKLVKDTSRPDKKLNKFMKLKKIMMKIVIKDIILKQMLNILKIYMNCIVIHHSYQRESKLISTTNSCKIYMMKAIMLFT